MSLIPQFKTELQYIPTVKTCLKLSWVDCPAVFVRGLKGSLDLRPRKERNPKETVFTYE